MATRDCSAHPGVPSVAVCGGCQKTLCTACATVTRAGTYCGTACKFQALQGSEGGGKKGGIAAKVLTLAVLALVAGLFILHLAVRKLPPEHVMRKLDVIGQILGRR